jgi:hypothetical protein
MKQQPDRSSAFQIMWHKLLDDIGDCGGLRLAQALG